MKLIDKEIEFIILNTVKKMYGDVELSPVTIQAATNAKFGDYQTNFAMVNAKVLKNNPRAIAETIVNNLDENKIIEKVEVAGPGFINIFLNNQYLGKKIKEIGVENFDFSFLNLDGDVIIDYSSPNIAKRMHIGHLRSTVIGDSIKRIYKFLGYKVTADNHIGDWGTQFGKLMVGYENWLDQDAYKENAIEELERIYVLFSEKAKEDESLEDTARAELKKLQAGDPENTRVWKEIIKASMAEYDKIYNRLDISFDTTYGESFYNDMMPSVVTDLKSKGIATENEGAQLVFFNEEDNLHPCIIQKSDGAYLYATSDLATIKFRRENYDINKVIYVTDERQQDHFKQIFKISEMLNWDEEKVHIWFGIMRFADGIFSSRKGNVIKLQDLLDEAKSRAKAIVEEKNPNLTDDEKENIAEVVGVGAVKYADLSQNKQSAIIFEWDKILSFEGNTAPYLQYSYARIQSIIRKANEKGIKIDYNKDIILNDKSEKALALALMEFPNSVLVAAKTYKPNMLADYLYETSKKFNSFYNALHILSEENDILQSRLLLIEKTAEIIKQGLDLLGIKTVNRM